MLSKNYWKTSLVERTVYDPLPSNFSLNMTLQDFPTCWENQNVLEQTATCPFAFVCVTPHHEAWWSKLGGGGVGYKVSPVNNIYLASITGRSLRDRFSLLPLNTSKGKFWKRGSTWLLSKFKMYFWRVGKRIIITPSSRNLIFWNISKALKVLRNKEVFKNMPNWYRNIFWKLLLMIPKKIGKSENHFTHKTVLLSSKKLQIEEDFSLQRHESEGAFLLWTQET